MVYDCTMTGVSWIEHGSQGPGGIWVSDDMCALDKAIRSKGPGGIWLHDGRCVLDRAMPLRRPRWYIVA